jgi:hypothetical protein
MTDFLFVPANLQALVVWRSWEENEGPYDLVPVPRDEGTLRNWYQNAPNKLSPWAPGRRLRGELKRGVHLHWALPPGLTGMREGSGGQPLIPNRWLILRMLREKGSTTPSLRGWVIESDFVSADPGYGGTPFPFLGTLGPLSGLLGTKRCGYLGRTHRLAECEWSENAAPYRFDLRSFAWGDPGFAAYYPACKGALGFHDPMEDGREGDLLTYTYLVVGWYSEAAKDPLHSGGTAQQLAPLGWMCPGQQATARPTRVLLHGAVTGLKWRDYSPGIDPQRSTVAIGGSSAESTVALVAAGVTDTQRAGLEQALCAFQNGFAQQVSSPDELDELIHRQGFGTLPGGSRWSIVPAKRDIDAAAPPARPAPESVASLLHSLNVAQRALDRKDNERQSQNWRLFALWATWASDQGTPRQLERKTIEAEFTRLTNAVANAGAEVKELEIAVAGLSANLSEALKTSGSLLEKSGQPPFLHPKDPFLAFDSDFLFPGDTARFERPVLEDNTPVPLRCRLRGDLLSGARRAGPMPQEWDASPVVLPEFGAKLDGLREAVESLAREALLFDPENTDWRAEFSREEVHGLQENFDDTKPKSGLGWNGTPPDRFAVTRWRDDAGANPWLPLYLLWRVEWTPDYQPGKQGNGNGIHGEALGGWRLDPDAVHVDLERARKPEAGEALTFDGATLLTQLSGARLAGALQDYFGQKSGPLSRVKTTKMGQALGGLNELMLRQALGLFLPPVDPESKLTDPIAFDPIWKATGMAVQPVRPLIGRAFLPVRTGSLKLQDVLVADAFGRTRRLAGARDANYPGRKVIASAALPADPLPGRHAGFRPRLVQPARLNFDSIPAGDGTASGVCGWIVPNFLEKSFDIFGAAGDPLGTLAIAASNAPGRFVWRPKPGSTLAIADITNSLLQRFVELVEHFSMGEGNAFLELVDLVERKADARVPPEDPALAVLLGRPLALVQASLVLELHGLPAGYWDFEKEWQFKDEEVENLRIPVRLGGMKLRIDGLVGYRLETPEQQEPFVAAWGAPGRTIARGDGERVRFKYGQDLSVNCAEAIKLTLLMDVGARVHATTGILPRHSFELAPDAARRAGQIEEFYIRVAPVLGQRTADQGPAMPRPSDAFGQWSWATRPTVAADWHAIRAADDRAHFDGGLALSEGWLRLSPNPKAALAK